MFYFSTIRVRFDAYENRTQVFKEKESVRNEVIDMTLTVSH